MSQVMTEKNPISALNEYCNQRKLARPFFNEKEKTGPPHMPSFTFEVQVGSNITAGTALTKQRAKTECAIKMLQLLLEDKMPQNLSDVNINHCKSVGSGSQSISVPKSHSDSSIQQSGHLSSGNSASQASGALSDDMNFVESYPKQSLDAFLSKHGFPPSELTEKVLPLDASQNVYVVTCTIKKPNSDDIVKVAVALSLDTALKDACNQMFDFVFTTSSIQKNVPVPSPTSFPVRTDPAEVKFHHQKIFKEIKKRQGSLNHTRRIVEARLQKDSPVLDVIDTLNEIGLELGFFDAYSGYPDLNGLQLHNQPQNNQGGLVTQEAVFLRTCKLTFSNVRPAIIFTGKSFEGERKADEDCAQNAILYLLNMEDKILAGQVSGL